jgi:LPPG:FO 2-phospho-L-lactate transferase
VSIGPILALPGVRDALRAHPRVVAVSPIVQGRPLKGPADKLLRAVGAASSASGVAELYRDFCNVFVVDASDEDELPKVEATEVTAASLDTIMSDDAAAARLAAELLAQ